MASDNADGEGRPFMSRKELNTEATRQALLAAARRYFAQEGYSNADTGRIAAEAGLTTGAVYHHFANKRGLFLAVAETLEAEILAAALAVAPAEDPILRIKMGFEQLIDVCAKPDVQRIIFIEAPQVLGPQDWRKVELRYALGALRDAVAALRAAGLIDPYPEELVARTLLALLRETSAEVARTPNNPVVREQIGQLAQKVLNGLLTADRQPQRR